MATFTYKYIGAQPVHFPALGIEVNHGDVLETEHAIKHPDFEAVTDHKKKEEPKAHK